MKFIKSALLTGVGVTTLSLGTAGVASAHAGSTQQNRETLSSRIATRFSLNQTDVQTTIDQYRSEHKKDWTAKRTAWLQQAVTDGKITQAQSDYITNAWTEIDALVAQTKTSDRDANRETWKQVKQKVEDLKTWATSQGIDSKYVSFGAWGYHHSWNRNTDHYKSH